jgi:hypothetical protein
VLTWTSNIPLASTSTAHYLYRVYRRPEGSQQQILAGELPTADGRGFTITDSSIEWESTYEYHAETVTLVPQENKPELEVPGDDSPEIKVFAHDIFSPAVPSGLQAVASGPGQKTFVDLVWAPVTDVDLDGYNVYRHVDGMAPLKLNAAPLSAPAFRDTNIMPGNRYLYTVSAVDVRGNESGHSEEAGESVP